MFLSVHGTNLISTIVSLPCPNHNHLVNESFLTDFEFLLHLANSKISGGENRLSIAYPYQIGPTMKQQ